MASRKGKAQGSIETEREIQEAQEVARVPSRAKVTTGKPRRILSSSGMRSKVAFPAAGNTVGGAGGNFYSPELSTDFLELPQSLDEQRNYYRFFYKTDPFVGQAIDLHTELPLSKVRLGMPEAKNRELAEKALAFCEKWATRHNLMHRLIEIVHEYQLLGEVFIFMEDGSPDMPDDIVNETIREVKDDGSLIERTVKRKDADERAEKWLKKNYRGWTAIRILPPEQIHMESFPFTDEKIIELIPDSKTKNLIGQANNGDEQAERIVKSMPKDVVEAILEGRNIPLNTDPEAGSFVYYMSRKKSQYDPRGTSVLERCIRTLVYRDKLRQAQTSIASRHMTPMRIVYAENMDANDTDQLREQVDMALADPDYSIVTNFQVTWEEMGSQSRLLDLSSEYDLTDRQMYAGLGVTESMLSGESSYSGDRINIEIVNTRYMLLREILQDLIEQYVFRPMCARMGFIEQGDDGNDEVIVPKLTFTRLGLRDNADTFDHLFSLYQKGSLDVDIILELMNIDPVMTLKKIKRDLFTPNDPTFNEATRGVYGAVADKIVEGTDVLKKIADGMGLKYTTPSTGSEERF